MRTTFLFLLASFLCLGYSKAQSQFTLTTSATPSCSNDGTLTITFSNGVAPFQLQVYGLPAGYIYNGSVPNNSITLNNMRNGEYTLWATDANGTRASTGFWENMFFATVPAQYTASFAGVNATCSDNGSITASPLGGTAPYQYSWSNGSTSSTALGLNPVTPYFVSITDANGCIYNSDSLQIFDNSNFTVSVNTTNKVCLTGGTASVWVSGSGPYTYSWNTSPIQTTSSASGLDEGEYIVTVTDENGCSVKEKLYIFEVNSFALNPVINNESCSQADGSITVSPSNGTAPYTCLWSTGETSTTIDQLTAYINYSITVTDAAGCVSKNTYAVGRTSPIEATITSTSALCNNTGGSATVSADNGLEPYSYMWNTGQTTSSISNLAAGDYYVTVTDSKGCKSYKHASVSIPPSCLATITGSIYNDLNSNCTKDAGEEIATYTPVMYAPGKYTYTDYNGDYSISVNPGTYTLQITPPASWIQTCLPNPYSISVNASTSGNTYANNNFALSPSTSESNVNINMHSVAPRPGFISDVDIYYSNIGNQIESGTIEYTFSNDWDWSAASPSPDSYDAITRKATWSYTLTPFKTQGIKIYMQVPTSTSLGTLLTASASISTSQTDIDLSNNNNNITRTVVGSFDPNDIQVSPQGEGSEGYITTEKEMTYRIRFQNTGTAEAFNVSVTNEIDPNLIDYTLTIIDASHAFTAKIENGLITFDFPNINLPDSNSNEPASHGYIIYKVNRISDLDAETKIYNQANIYFDYNSAVETNRVQNTIAGTSPTTSSYETANAFSYYPNPCKNLLNIRFNAKRESNLSVQLYTTSGQNISLLENTTVHQGEQSIQLDLSNYSIPNGLYIVKSILNEEVNTQQVLIMR